MEVVLNFVQKQLNLGWAEVPPVHVVVWAGPHPPDPAFKEEEMRARASVPPLHPCGSAQNIPAHGTETSATSLVASHPELCVTAWVGDGITLGTSQHSWAGMSFYGSRMEREDQTGRRKLSDGAQRKVIAGEEKPRMCGMCGMSGILFPPSR